MIRHSLKKGRPLRQFTLGAAKSAGRNSSGRITSFHRGGGSKRLQRTLDVKRSTPSVGIVERIEYDPNRSSSIAAVRWVEGVHLPRQSKHNNTTLQEHKIFQPTIVSSSSLFSFSALPGKVAQTNVPSFSPGLKAAYAMVGLPSRASPQASAGTKKTCSKDVFLSALSSPKPKGQTAPLSFALPRIAVAGAKPSFFAPGMKDELTGKNTFSLGEVQKLNTDSIMWTHRIKRKAALSWKSFRQQETLGLVGAAEHNKSKLKTDQGDLPAKRIGGPKDGSCKVNRAPAV